MSKRNYLLVGNERIYDYDPSSKVEFVCDACNEPIADDVAQIHLHVRRGTARDESGETKEIDWFGVDLHLGCVSNSGKALDRLIISNSRKGRSYDQHFYRSGWSG